MGPNTTLRLDKLTLSNFRCFKSCAVELDPKLTVFVADNAQGKTALLNGISIALDVFVSTIGFNQCHGFNRSDIHLLRQDKIKMVPASSVEFRAEGLVVDQKLQWSRSLSSASTLSRSSTKDVKNLRTAAELLAHRALNDHQGVQEPLPFVAFYGTGRLWDEHRLTVGKKVISFAASDRFSAYVDCLSPSSSFKTFSSWYEETSNSLRFPAFKTFRYSARPETLLAAVRKAVAVVLEPTGWTHLDWEFPQLNEFGIPLERGFLVVEHHERGRLPLSWLSDGVRNMIALVGDLAHRCARLNPHLGEDAASQTPGVLLIDEVDMHLHPKWQQLVIGLLQKAFPAMQLILSTHSPQVLTTLRKENIRMIVCDEEGQWTTEMPKSSPLAHDSGDALAFVMGADPVPQLEILKDIHIYEQIARAGESDTDKAVEILTRLESAGFEFSDAQKYLFSFLAKNSKQSKEAHNG